MTLLAIALLQTPATLASFEILEKGLPKQAVYVDHVSRNGKAILARSGQTYFVILGDEIRGAQGVPMIGRVQTAIHNDGTILTHRILRGFVHVILYRAGSFQVIGKEEQMNGSGFYANGFASDGGVFGFESHGEKRWHFVVRDGRKELVAGSEQGVGRILDEVEDGYLAEVLIVKRSGRSTSGSAFPAYLRNGVADFFQLPSGPKDGAMITAWSEDGSTVAGFVTPSMAVTIWRDGELLATLPRRGMSEYRLTSVTAAGDMLVGCRNYHRPDLAIIWREKEGLQSLVDFARERKVEISEGWTPIDAVFVSPDGKTIIGTAKHMDNRIRPFRMTLPPPEKKEDGG